MMRCCLSAHPSFQHRPAVWAMCTSPCTPPIWTPNPPSTTRLQGRAVSVSEPPPRGRSRHRHSTPLPAPKSKHSYSHNALRCHCQSSRSGTHSAANIVVENQFESIPSTFSAHWKWTYSEMLSAIYFCCCCFPQMPFFSLRMTFLLRSRKVFFLIDWYLSCIF